MWFLYKLRFIKTNQTERKDKHIFFSDSIFFKSQHETLFFKVNLIWY